MRSLSCWFRCFAVSVITLFLFACGGGGGGTNGVSTVSSAGTGTVTLLLTDAPSDDFKAINLDVVRAELFSDNGRVELFSGKKTFDLLQLANVTEIFSVTSVPAGTYNKIRLTLTRIELVRKDGTKVYPDLPGNGKLDLNPRGSFVVSSGSTMLIQLDMDAEKSIKVTSTATGDKVQFRPVVFVRIITDRLGTKLVRLRGAVNNLDTLAGTFDLCRIEVQGLLLDDDENDGKPYCVMIDTAQVPASFFDINGDPAAIGSFKNGDIVTAAGRFAFDGASIASSNGNRRSDDRSRHDDDNSRDDDERDDHDRDDNDHRDMVLFAEVVWQGDFAEVKGTARSSVNTDVDRGTWFRFEVLAGQGYNFGAPIPVILQTGTRLYNRQGLPINESAIMDGVTGKVVGVFQDKPVELKAALAIFDTSAKQTQLIGTIGTVSGDFSSMTLQAGGGDRCVLIDTRPAGTQIFETSLGSDNSIDFDQKLASDLQSGQTANVFGDPDVTGCLKAETIIYEAQVTAPPVQALR